MSDQCVHIIRQNGKYRAKVSMLTQPSMGGQLLHHGSHPTFAHMLKYVEWAHKHGMSVHRWKQRTGLFGRYVLVETLNPKPLPSSSSIKYQPREGVN